MKTQPSSKKTLVGIAIIIGAVAVGYFFYAGKNPVSTGALVQEANPEANAVSARILSLLNQIRSLKIDTALFDDPIFGSLQDRSTQIPPVEVGRPNPFAPIPGVSETPASGTTR